MTMSLPVARAQTAGLEGTGRRRRIRQRTLAGWLCLVPFLVVNSLVIVGPSIATVYYSFTDWTGIGGVAFVGLDNYRQLVSDDNFRTALLHVVQWMAFFLTVPIAMALLGSYLLSQVRRFQLLFRLVYFIPYIIASVVNAAIWKNIYDGNRGLLPLLADAGVSSLQGVAILGNKQLALPAVAWVDTWHWWGFLVVVFLAAMRSVDPELYDAVKIDGGGRWREFRDVTLPGIQATLVFVFLITVIGSLLAFDYIYIMTQGGPAGATEVVGTLLYERAFSLFEAGYAAAMGLSMTLLSGVVMLAYLALRRRGWEV
ncbi:MAG: sugar-binding protein [Thermomicrobiales bacterium]|jgi:raffinose/stachyose/melibiose transport system permease protein|nr:sugar-binding protein [Thermomicrobiales bacterium]MDF3040005.1 sugar-binding protein [Thermomicrobiales bacterium]